VTGIGAETRVGELIESALAAWGIPAAIILGSQSEFAALLADRGSSIGSAGDAKVRVRRSPVGCRA
jgi:hypothetical protein